MAEGGDQNYMGDMKSRNQQVTKIISKVISILDISSPILRTIYIIGGVIGFLLVLFVTADVVLRYVFNRPIGGSIEITQIAVVMVVWLTVGWAQASKSHIRVDIITDRLSSEDRTALDIATYIFVIWVIIILIWRGLENVLWFVHIKKISDVYSIPLAPFAIIIPFGCALTLIAVLRDFCGRILDGIKLEFSPRRWSLSLGGPVIIIVLFLFWMMPPFAEMLDPPIAGCIGIFIGFIFLFLGMPIGLCLAMAGFVFVGNILGASQGFSMVGGDLYFHTAKYDWSVIVLFLIMGAFIVQTNVGTDAYNAAHKWAGHLPGGLAIATIFASSFIAAVIGSPTPCVITMGDIALPEMRKHRYSDKLIAGVIVSGASLGPLIPPSVAFILYGIFAEVSIGELFMAGIIPGIILMMSFAITIYIQCRLNPELGPQSEPSSLKQKITSLKGGGPIILIFLIVMGGIFFGVFTAVEGGAIGAFSSFVVGIIMRRLNFKKFAAAILQSGNMVATVLIMLIGALVFGRLLTASNLTILLVDFIGGSGLSPLMFVIVITIMYVILGCIMDAGLVLILTVPILAPMARALGIDMVWLGAVIVVASNLGSYSPPYGLSLFIYKSIAGIPLKTIYRGAIPYVIINLLVIIFIIFVPTIVTWLPNIIK